MKFKLLMNFLLKMDERDEFIEDNVVELSVSTRKGIIFYIKILLPKTV